MKPYLIMVAFFAFPLALAALAVIAAVQGDWTSAGVCALFAVLLAGARVIG